MEHTEIAASPPASIDPFEGVVETFNEADIRVTRRFLAHEGHGVTENRVGTGEADGRLSFDDEGNHRKSQASIQQGPFQLLLPTRSAGFAARVPVRK